MQFFLRKDIFTAENHTCNLNLAQMHMDLREQVRDLVDNQDVSKTKLDSDNVNLKIERDQLKQQLEILSREKQECDGNLEKSDLKYQNLMNFLNNPLIIKCKNNPKVAVRGSGRGTCSICQSQGVILFFFYDT
jgi:hypothetical protein